MARYFFVDNTPNVEIGVLLLTNKDAKTWCKVIDEIYNKTDRTFTWIGIDTDNNNIEKIFKAYPVLGRKSILIQNKISDLAGLREVLSETLIAKEEPDSWSSQLYEQQMDCYLSKFKKQG